MLGAATPCAVLQRKELCRCLCAPAWLPPLQVELEPLGLHTPLAVLCCAVLFCAVCAARAVFLQALSHPAHPAGLPHTQLPLREADPCRAVLAREELCTPGIPTELWGRLSSCRRAEEGLAVVGHEGTALSWRRVGLGWILAGNPSL